MKNYIVKVTGIFILSLLIFWGSYLCHEWNSIAGMLVIILAWLALTVYLLVINHKIFRQNKAIVLNVFNWLLTLMLLALAFSLLKDRMLSFAAIPSFAFITSLVYIVKNILSKDKNTDKSVDSFLQ